MKPQGSLARLVRFIGVPRVGPLRVALTATALCILGPGTARPAPPQPSLAEPATPTPSAPAMRTPGCPATTLPDGDGVCVHLPTSDEGGPAIESSVNAHRDRRGQWLVYDQIPRR